jgi:3D-(3,5/4)-trihydroxycyclohexane-1,2-dione acylhydrolase (decyclizing)
MLHSELVTSIQEGIKINVVLCDNSGFGCIENLQSSKGIPKFGCDFRYRNKKSGLLDGEKMTIDYAANARSYGCEAWTATNAKEFEEAMKKARQSKVSTLIDAKVDPKTMSGGYECWWRVGIPEVSEKTDVVKAFNEQKEEIKKTLQN